VSQIDFHYDGDQSPPRLLNFDGPAFGAVFSGASLFASIAWGSQDADPTDTTTVDQRLLDFSLLTWGELYLTEEGPSALHRFFIPITLYSNFRRVAPRSTGSPVGDFSVTVLGLGAGVGFSSQLGPGVLFYLRATPVIGIAAQSFGDNTGYAKLIDSMAEVHIGRPEDRVGVSLGYGFRATIWDVGGSDLFVGVPDDLFDYRETMHTFSLGVNF
jgi:hypothetical protein